MVKTKKDIRAIHFDSIFLILILFFGLQICQNTDFNKSVPNGKPVPIEISINQSNATISSGIQFYFFQKCWISNKDNFRLLTFEQTKYLDNKKVDQKYYYSDKFKCWPVIESSVTKNISTNTVYQYRRSTSNLNSII